MRRTLFAAVLVLFTAACGYAQDKKVEKKDEKKDEKKAVNLYPLAKGSKWEYKVAVAGQEMAASQEVTDVSEAKKGERAVATIATKVATPMGEQNLTEEMSADDKGVYRHAMQGQKLDNPIFAIKYPVKAGTKWNEKLKVMGQDVDADFEMKATEKVKVAAGEYDAYPVEMSIKVGGMTVTATNWYADGVGIVKQVMDAGAFKMEMELKKFTAGK